MQQLTPEGQRLATRLAERHGFSPEAVAHMLAAVRNGNGGLAQFNHPEFSGAGQWMRGGMLMLGDMFNHALKARVDALCTEIAGILSSELAGSDSLFATDHAANWWPRPLGSPNATGSQNDIRYAYFATPHRLAVQSRDGIRVYDTLDHQIRGFSQQQGHGERVSFVSQHGVVDLSSLPLVSSSERPSPASPQAPSQSPSRPNDDVFAAIERLGKLHADGLLTDEEFAGKKAELLQRI
ncbi:MAG: SHOCT domain-containing protein [Pseudomonadales bacterium]